MDFLPEQIRQLNGWPLIASVIWILLIGIIPISILIIRFIKNIDNSKKNNHKHLSKKAAYKENFKVKGKPDGF